MHHTTSSRPSAKLGCHVHKTLNLSMHITIRDVSPVLAPLAREDAACWSFLWHRCNRVSNKWQFLSFVQKRPPASARREELVDERGVYYSDKRLVLVDKGNGDTKHGEEVDVVDGAVQRINAPCRTFVNEVVATRAF